MRRLFLATIGLIIAFGFSGCSSKNSYGSSNNINHAYITNTQMGGHSLTGVSVRFVGDARNTIVGGLGQLLTLTKMDVTYYLNREEVDTFNSSSTGYRTFIKLPPGEHEFAYRVNTRGFMTLGLSTDKIWHVYKFDLKKGDIAVIKIYPYFKNKETRELKIDFENVLDFQHIGSCYNDYSECNPI